MPDTRENTLIQQAIPMPIGIEPMAPDISTPQNVPKQPQKRFNIFILIGVSLLLIFGIGGFWMYMNSYNIRNLSGQIMVSFAPGTSDQVALAVLRKYFLKIPNNFFMYDKAHLLSKDNRLDEEVLQLLKNPLIKSARVLGREGGIGNPEIVVSFSRWVSMDEINTLLTSFDDLYVKHSQRNYVFKVFKGTEALYCFLLRMESSVQYAEIDQIITIPIQRLRRKY